jgi:hypothetical protein
VCFWLIDGNVVGTDEVALATVAVVSIVLSIAEVAVTVAEEAEGPEFSAELIGFTEEGLARFPLTNTTSTAAYLPIIVINISTIGGMGFKHTRR